MNIIQSLWSGRKSLANGATLANSCLGITPRNERLANIPHPVVQQNLDIALNEYNKLLLSMNNGDSSILHLLTSERELDGDVYFEYGMYWRHFDEYNYNDRNIWIEKEDLKNIFEVKDDECYILKDKDTTKEIKELLRKRAPEFPPSVLANLATHNIRDTAYKYVIELYDKSPGCGVEVELTVSKPALKSNYSSFYIQSEYYNFPCDHVNGIQKQSIQSMHNMTLSECEKIGNVYSPVLTLMNFVKRGDIANIAAGIDDHGIYNVRNIQNLFKNIKSNENGILSTDIDTIKEIADKTYHRDLEFNKKPDKLLHRHLFGEIHNLQWTLPLSISLYNYTSFILCDKYAFDLHGDFTESLVADYCGYKTYNFILTMTSPLGGILPYPLLDALIQTPNGYSVQRILTDFFHGYRLYTGSKRKRVIHFHTDRFKGFLPALYYSFQLEGHHFNYLLHTVEFLEKMDNNILSKYPFKWCLGECHTMLALGNYDKNIKRWPTKNKYGHLCIMMDLHRHITYSLHPDTMMGYINLLHFLLTYRTIEFDAIKDYQYVTFDTIKERITKNMKSINDAEHTAEINKPQIISKQIKEIKEKIYDWDVPLNKNIKNKSNSSKYIAFLNNTAISRSVDGDLIYFRPFPRYPFIHAVGNVKNGSVTYFPPNITPNTSSLRNKKYAVKNEERCVLDWNS